ncbi:MAG: 2-C-methyl-D-erythritol 2,4-cyclodiphosphate synthase [Chloroflexi bacterium]|nr:2-C-methyl-D-erythritol 2,4-cyclodiphosphate synthase [Chloroflexota bacterium]
MRVGIGYDAHRLVAGKPLFLGGVEIPFERGLEGWSDADVLLHAIIDAMLGAAGAGDIGEHFPDTDPAYRGISSLTLLERADGVLAERGLSVAGVDSVLVLEEPKIKPYRDAIRGRIAKTLGLPADRVGVKAKTTEGLGFTGRGEGIAAHAVVLVEETGNRKSEAGDR